MQLGSFICMWACLLLLSYCFIHSETQNKHKSYAYTLEHFKESIVKHKKAISKEKLYLNWTKTIIRYDNVTNLKESIVSRKFHKQKPIELLTNNPQRKKRFILFNDGGVVKLILGISIPIILADPVRSISCFNNLQLQYTPPPNPLYFWSLYNTTTFPVAKKKKRQTRLRQENRDTSRELIYEVIKMIFERAGLPDEQCLLKMICEISRAPFHTTTNGNIFHEFLNAIFIPKLQNIDVRYLNALNAATCEYQCPQRMNWLERNSILY